MSALRGAAAETLSRRPAAAAGPPLASGRDLVVRYRGRTVLDRVSIEVHRREVVSLIGPNGAGKTTAVRALLGLIKPDAGVVHREPGVVVGYVPQRIEPESLLPLTVRRFPGDGRTADPCRRCRNTGRGGSGGGNRPPAEQPFRR